MRNLQKRALFLSATTTIIAFAVFFNAGCAKKDAGQHGAASPAPTVIVAEVTRRTVPIYSEFVGQTKADDTVELRARVEGTLIKVHFREGAPVRKGQLLFTIDKRPFEAALQSARALAIKASSDL